MKGSFNLLDRLCSELVRLRALLNAGGCEYCRRPFGFGQLEWSHFFKRSRWSVRWDLDNAAGLCAACHRFFEDHPADHALWFREYLGIEKYAELAARQKQLGKPDPAPLIIEYRQKISDIKAGLYAREMRG